MRQQDPGELLFGIESVYKAQTVKVSEIRKALDGVKLDGVKKESLLKRALKKLNKLVSEK